MIAKVQKWGNSLGLRIPKAFAAEAGLASGASVNLTSRDGRLVVTPLVSAKYELDELLAGVTPRNLHAAEWPAGAAGRESPL